MPAEIFKRCVLSIAGTEDGYLVPKSEFFMNICHRPRPKASPLDCRIGAARLEKPLTFGTGGDLPRAMTMLRKVPVDEAHRTRLPERRKGRAQ